MSGFTYQNAPLVEVIAEVHWRLRTLDSDSGTQTDPYYFPLQDSFVKETTESGLIHKEELVPNFVPIEHTASRPRLRLRKGVDQWPVVQLGPGIMTANVVPPYKGWAEFEPFLQDQIYRLLNIYQSVGDSLSISKLHLRYIDGFDHKFQFDHYPTFAKNMLNISSPINKTFYEEHVLEGCEFSYVTEVSFFCKAPSQSTGRLKICPGLLKSANALIMEISCETRSEDRIQNRTQIKDWFSQAHKAIKRQFHTLTTSDLKTLMHQTPKVENSNS